MGSWSTWGQCVRVWWLQHSPEVLGGQAFCSWATLTHCVGRMQACRMCGGLTLQHLLPPACGYGSKFTNHQSMRLDLSGALL